MKRTLSVNIGGIAFHIDEDAHALLNKYLRNVKDEFRNMEGGEEIYEDIESRIAELFTAKLNNSRQVITIREVDEVIATLGEPSDFSDTSGSSKYSGFRTYTNRRMYRDPDNRIIGGVCSGLAAYWRVDPTIVRLIFVLLAIFGMAGVLIYLILWIILPEAQTISQKLEMRGEPVNFSSIGAFLRDEFENVKRSFAKR